MITYGDGKAGQYAKSEAYKRFNRVFAFVVGLIALAGLCAGIFVAYALFVVLKRPWSPTTSLAARFAGLAVLEACFIIIIAMLYRRLRRPMNTLAAERVHLLRGGQAEALVAYSLRELPDQWHLFNNIAMKGGGDIDHVLLGPGGLFCLSTKSQKGLYERDQSGKFLLNREPTNHLSQAQNLAMKLRNWLEARLQPIHAVKSIPFVQPILVNPFAHIGFPRKSDNVWVMDERELFDHASNAKTTLSSDQIDGCVEILKELSGRSEQNAEPR